MPASCEKVKEFTSRWKYCDQLEEGHYKDVMVEAGFMQHIAVQDGDDQYNAQWHPELAGVFMSSSRGLCSVLLDFRSRVLRRLARVMKLLTGKGI